MADSSITDLESQAAAGDLSAQITMARTLLDAGQTEAGRNWLRRAAESGPTDIKLALGEQLIANPPYEVAEALHWTHAAAEEGARRPPIASPSSRPRAWVSPRAGPMRSSI